MRLFIFAFIICVHTKYILYTFIKSNSKIALPGAENSRIPDFLGFTDFPGSQPSRKTAGLLPCLQLIKEFLLKEQVKTKLFHKSEERAKRKWRFLTTVKYEWHSRLCFYSTVNQIKSNISNTCKLISFSLLSKNLPIQKFDCWSCENGGFL